MRRIENAFIALLGIVCLFLVARYREPHRHPVRPAETAASSARKAETPAQGPIGVAIRLADRLDQAVIDAPSFAEADRSLSYWRRMRSPWHTQKSVQSVSVTRQRGHKNKGQQLGKAGRWQPDPKVWNMDEGSFDQRESIVLPPPGSIRFPNLAIPKGAFLSTAPAIIGREGVEFSVSIRVGTEKKLLGKRLLAAGTPHGYREWKLDLAEFAEKSVDLELSSRALDAGTAPFALWGAPRIYAPGTSALPFNVVFIVVDAMRGDALAATHDPEIDRQMQAGKLPPLDAWLPKLPGIAPNLDRLANEGAIFTRAFSGATWTRPGTIAMMTGAHSTAHGMPTLNLIPTVDQVRGFYARRPPLLPLLLREHGVQSHAIVNNFYIVGYAGVGVDMGFESLVDHRYEVEDTEHITEDAKEFLSEKKGERFFLFLNYDSPHVPYRPSKSLFAEISKEPGIPNERLIRAYLAEIHKDDRAIGEVMKKLSELGLADDTLVIVTADHGETLSEEHGAVPAGVDGGPPVSGRFHHLSSLWDETVRVPLLFRLPKRIAKGTRIPTPVSTVDIVPTVMELAGFERPKGVTGQSLVPLLSGQKAETKTERILISEGRGAHALRVGRWRLVVRDPAYRRVHFSTLQARLEHEFELYDLESDPGERLDVAAQHPDVVKRLSALDPTKKSDVSVEKSHGKLALHLRFSPGGTPGRVLGKLTAKNGKTLRVTPVGLPADAAKPSGTTSSIDFALSDGVVGFDIEVEPASAELEWKLELDGKPIPEVDWHAGPFAIPAKRLASGLVNAAARDAIAGDGAPDLDPVRDRGVYVFADSGAREVTFESEDAKKEAMGLMRAWGYVR